MKRTRLFKPLTALPLAALLVLPLVASAVAAPQNSATDQMSAHDNTYIQLGKVKVIGQKQIIATLQAIKVGLDMPYSSDPKLANVVVCRLVDEAGSHIKQWLICGTNRILGQQRDAIHLAMDAAVTAGSSTGSANCTSGACYTRVFAVLNATLNSQPAGYLHTLVNGSALHALLEKIPYPTPAPPATSAPAAGSRN